MFDSKISENVNQGGFADFDDIKDECELFDYVNRHGEVAGVTISTDGKTGYVHLDDGFYIVVGATGSKKTRDVCAPYIVNNAIAGNSMIITDVKGDLYKTLSKLLEMLGYTIRVLDFNDPSRGDAYNPMRYLYRAYKEKKLDKVNRELRNTGDMIFDGMKSEKDPFWTATSGDLFQGCELVLFEEFDEEQATIANALNLYIQGEKNFAGSNYMKEYFSDKENSQAYKLMAATLNAPNDTKASIVSVYTSSLNKLIGQNESLSKMMSHSTFEIEDLVKEKTAVFIIANEVSLSVHSGLITALIQQWYDILVEISDKNGGELERSVTFVLDEFGNLPALIDFQTKVSLSRARKIYWMIVIQSFAQLDLRYGKDVARTIVGNTSNWIYMHSPDPELLKYVSDLTGVVKDEMGRSSNLLSVNQLRHFQKCNDEGRTECLMLLGRLAPFVSYLPDISEYYGVDPIGALDIPERVDPDVEEINFKGLVEKRRKKKIEAEIEERRQKEMAEKRQREALRKEIYQESRDVSMIINDVIYSLKGGKD